MFDTWMDKELYNNYYVIIYIYIMCVCYGLKAMDGEREREREGERERERRERDRARYICYLVIYLFICKFMYLCVGCASMCNVKHILARWQVKICRHVVLCVLFV